MTGARRRRWLIAFGVGLAISLCLPVYILAGPNHVPHEDPAASQDSLDDVALLVSYINVFNAAADGRYQDAQAMLNELEHTRFPDELRDIINRYKSVSTQLFTGLDKADTELKRVSGMLANNQVDDARQELGQADLTIGGIQALLEEVTFITADVGGNLGISAVTANSQAGRSYERLQQSLQRVKEFTDRLNQKRQEMVDTQIPAKELMLTPTKLSLSATPTSVFVGDRLTISGSLNGGGEPLPQKQVTLFLGEVPFTVTTTGDGSYTAGMPIPYDYSGTAVAYAEYVPAGNDIAIFKAGRSPAVTVQTGFYASRLEVDAPESGSPGLPITVSGTVNSGNEARVVNFFLDDVWFAEVQVDDKFSLELALPSGASAGNHILTVALLPSGRYSGASKNHGIVLSRLELEASVTTSPLVLAPAAFEVSGRFYYGDIPAQNAAVKLTFRGSTSTATTGGDGSFTARIMAPLDTPLVGTQDLVINVEPAEPWFAPLQVTSPVFALSLANTGLMLAGLVCVGMMIYRRGRRTVKEEMATATPAIAKLPLPLPANIKSGQITGVRGRILSAYSGGLKSIQKRANLPANPHTTLREFLNLAVSRMPAIEMPFAELTGIAEAALYSACIPDAADALRAETLTATIRKELRDDVA